MTSCARHSGGTAFAKWFQLGIAAGGPTPFSVAGFEAMRLMPI
jgi:hypothetical protein